ncbi:DUF5602 domain-containing protein [Leptolyngbya sp. DQ-M1]|uniref:DUF5602 domain-containing protein n=1 Tax=Leptolyngbya sp. DQ-M1 TaxID=2933920 RepID=UPI0032991791
MRKSHKLGIFISGLLMLLVVSINAVHANTIVQGTPQSIGQGTARSYVALDNRSRVSELGVILSESALSDLPTTMTEIELALPRQASRTTPFTHIGLNWNPQGHPPAPIYGTPHFDVHFYTISQAARRRITAIGKDAERAYITPDARFIPAGYVMAPDSAEPGQGSHWIDPKSDEFQGAPHGFNHTFIYGFYNGKMNFLEPMISKAAFDQRQSFQKTIARPVRYSTLGRYPRQYSMSYDSQAHQFRISLSKFVQ